MSQGTAGEDFPRREIQGNKITKGARPYPKIPAPSTGHHEKQGRGEGQKREKHWQRGWPEGSKARKDRGVMRQVSSIAPNREGAKSRIHRRTSLIVLGLRLIKKQLFSDVRRTESPTKKRPVRGKKTQKRESTG